MSTNFVTPNLGLTVPVPGQEPGPQFATDISNDLVIIDTKVYSANNPAVPAGIDIDADLTFQDNNATNLRSTRLVSQSSVLVGTADLNCVYVVNGNLYFNNASGVPVEITTGGSPAPTSFTAFDVQVDDSATWTILSTDQYQMIEVAYTATGPASIILPLSSALPDGRFYVIKDAAGNAGTHNLTINVAGGSGDTIEGASSYLINTNLGVAFIWTDASGNWYLLGGDINISGSHAIHLSGTATLSADAGTTVNINGTFHTNAITSVGDLDVTSTGEIEVQATTTLLLESTTDNVILLADTGNVNVSTPSGAMVIGNELQIQSAATLQVASGGTLSMVSGSTMSGTILGDQTWSGNPTFNGTTTFGGSAVMDSGVVVNGTLTSTSGSVFGFSSVNVTLPASGTLTLTSAQYNHAVLLNVGSLSFSGDVTVIFPEVNGFWILQTGGINLNGHSLIISQATSGDTSPLSVLGAMTFIIGYAGGGINAAVTQ